MVHGQLAVAVAGLAVGRTVAASTSRVEAAQHPGAAGRQLGQRLGQVGQVGGRDAQLGGLLAQRVPAADPQLAVAAVRKNSSVSRGERGRT